MGTKDEQLAHEELVEEFQWNSFQIEILWPQQSGYKHTKGIEILSFITGSLVHVE